MLPCKLRLTGLNDSVVRPVFSLLATNAYTKLLGIFGFLALVIIFRSRICLSEHFFLYDIIGSLRISLSNGCCCTKCHLLLRISYDSYVYYLELLDSIVGQLRKGLELYYKWCISVIKIRWKLQLIGFSYDKKSANVVMWKDKEYEYISSAWNKQQ